MFLTDISKIFAYQNSPLSEKYMFLFFLHLPKLRAQHAPSQRCRLTKPFRWGRIFLWIAVKVIFCQSGSVSISQTVRSWGGYHYTLVNKHS